MLVDIEVNGYKYKVTVPNDSEPSTWQYGVIVGPPDLSDLNLPSNVKSKLHAELYNRGLITRQDIDKRGSEVFAALQAALRIDVASIVNLY